MNRSTITRLLLILIMLISVGYCVYRDIDLEKQYTYDLTNRVVGARLQMDGRSPYFYHWKTGDGFRYYDPANDTQLKLSSITASPFFHQLLYPLANLPHRTISKWWLVVEYVSYLIMVLLAMRITQERRDRFALLFIATLFLYSQAWISGIALGQMYFVMPLLAMIFIFLLQRSQHWWMGALAGAVAMSLVLIRVNSLAFLFPFLFCVGAYGTRFKLAFLAGGILILSMSILGGHNLEYWKDYREAVSEHVKYHQGLHPTLAVNEPNPRLEDWEGWKVQEIRASMGSKPFVQNGENGNIFVIVNNFFHLKTPLWVLSLMAFLFLVIATSAFYVKKGRPFGIDPVLLAILGWCCYMMTDLLSPIHRIQYNAVQWIFPLFLIAARSSTGFRMGYAVLAVVGVILNSLTFKMIPMQATLGEYLIFASVLLLLFTHKNNSPA